VARGSVTSFSAVAGGFVGKDVAVVGTIAEELGTDLGVLDDVIKVLTFPPRLKPGDSGPRKGSGSNSR